MQDVTPRINNGDVRRIFENSKQQGFVFPFETVINISDNMNYDGKVKLYNHYNDNPYFYTFQFNIRFVVSSKGGMGWQTFQGGFPIYKGNKFANEVSECTPAVYEDECNNLLLSRILNRLFNNKRDPYSEEWAQLVNLRALDKEMQMIWDALEAHNNLNEMGAKGGSSKKKYKGRTYTVRTGPRGGKYILVAGEKKYF